MTSLPPLIAATHGTRDAAGRAVIDDLRATIARARPDLTVLEAYVDEDVQQPGLTDVLGGLSNAIVVPVLLSSGYHVHTDVAAAVEAARSRSGEPASFKATRALGPDSVLADVLAERLADADADGHAVVLAAAGSSDQRASADVEATATLLAHRIGRPVTPGYATAATPRISDAIETLRRAGERVAAASYVLAPGHFHDRIAASGADVVTAPLLPHPAIPELILQRYDAALRAA